MFNFKNSNSGRMNVKILATLLVLTLSFANFALVGSYIGKSIAVDLNLSNQNNKTNSENVKFDVYLDEADRNAKEKTADINSKELKLFVSTSVQGGGYLKDATIELVNTNFKFKNNPEVTKVKLDSIQSGNGVSAGIDIVAKDNESYNLSLLDMQSQIRLTGEYISDKGSVTDIDTVKAVKVTWTTNELTDENISLSQEVITNKIYNIDGANKRVVQVLVKSNVKDNIAPEKSSVIEITNPKIGVDPEEITVAAYSTKATNGQNDLFQYLNEDGITKITVKNDASDENFVSWAKNAQNIFVVTYVYNETANVVPFISDAKVSVDIYGRTNEAIERTNSIKVEDLEEIGNIEKIETELTNEIYKGKMYIGEDTQYTERLNVYVPYSKLADSIVIESLEDEIAENISTYYKETKINRQDLVKLLGEEGTIKVYSEDNLIEEINLADETQEDYYVISYEDASKIKIEMSKVTSEGTIAVVNKKAIKVEDTNVVSEIKELKSNTKLFVKDENGKTVVNTISKKTAQLVEPKTEFNVSIDKKAISALGENTVKITAELIAKNEENKLYKNPTINIVLPKEIKEVSIEDITPVVGNSELKIKSYDVKTSENGNKVIVIELKGNQTSYSANSATITMDLKIKTNEFMADKNVEVKSTIINDAQKVTITNPLNIEAKTGLVTKSVVTVGNNKVEKTNQSKVTINAKANDEVTVATSVMNNYGDTLSDIDMTGKIPENATLESKVVTNVEEATVKYFAEDGTEVTELDKAKSFEIDTNKNLTQGATITLNYKYTIDNNAEDEQKSTIEVEGTVNEQPQEEVLIYVTNISNINTRQATLGTTVTQNGVTISIDPKTISNVLHEGQIITYSINVTNKSNEAINNATLNYSVPEGAVLTELTEAQGLDIVYSDKAGTRNKTWNIGVLSPNQTISKEVTIKILEGTTQITNNVSLLNGQNTEIGVLNLEPINVIEGDLNVVLGRIDNENIELTSKSEIEYRIAVTNNTESTIKNITIYSKLSETTGWVPDDEDNVGWTYNSDSKEISTRIDTLNPGQKVVKRVKLIVNKLDNTSKESVIENTFTATTENGNVFESNMYKNIIKKASWEITMTSAHEETLNEGDEVKYIIKVKNKGSRAGAVRVIDELPEEVQLRNLTSYIVENDKYESNATVKNVNITEVLEIGDTLTIEIDGVTFDLPNDIQSKQITNIAKISLGDGEYLQSNAITNTIMNDNYTDVPEDPENPTDPTNPSKDENKNTISGLAWLDENKDGVRDENEKVLQGVKVVLLDRDGKQIQEQTISLTGTYKFTDVEEGDYTVAFKYDSDKYAITKYQSNNATDETNSDAISKEIELNGEKVLVAITDTIKVTEEAVTNIDIGFIENAKFDLRLDKYINKVVLTNSAGTTTYEYEDTNFAKVEISAKRIEGTVLLVEYELKVTNEGDVDGYVGDVIDYLPDGMTFTSESNKEWYMDGNKVLHDKELSDQVIKAGETKSVTLVLTKTLKADSTGTIENIGEIGASRNLQSIAEVDSTVGNKMAGEDDMSTASLIVSISTGSPVMYIGIVIGTMLVLGLGIYIINKKVLKERI